MTESSPDDSNSKRKDFICGVVEGFYGRPWTTEQRKDLFQKLKKWGMDMYVYAPKDDYKHRAYWRELYTVEEAEHLTSLISAAKDQGIEFCYALSPGLDITYSSQKEITTLKRKLEQVAQFGCTCFSLLFDDIEPEMSESDKQVFQSFAHAQVSITNDIHQHLGCPRFLICPTQYCSTRAVPTVNSSEYLNTLGTKLSQQIDIMWTGPKVISKTLTTECIEEITAVLRRPPVIWDNLHANDYDQKRIFLGPYCGRSPELIPLLRGVLTNPNCEYNCNLVPIRTLALWARCYRNAPPQLEAVSWDIRLERECESGVCEDDAPPALPDRVYHPRQALRLAIREWLPEFSIPKTSQGPVIKPTPPVTVPPVPIIPILPSINTCMSLVTTTSTTSTTSTADIPTAIPTLNTSQLQVSPMETLSASVPVMNSLVSPSTVLVNSSIPNPIIGIASSNVTLPAEIPVSTLPVPVLHLHNIQQQHKHGEDSNDSVLESASFIEDMKKEENIIVDDESGDPGQQNGDMSVGDTPQTLSPWRETLEDPPSAAQDPDVVMQDGSSETGSMQVEASHSPLSGDMVIEPPEPIDAIEPVETDTPAVDTHQPEGQPADANALVEEDLLLLCDLFYLPFEHGSRGLRLMHDYNWLLTHAASMLPRAGNTPETSEWRRRRGRFSWWCGRARRALRRAGAAPHGELAAELQPYLHELCAVLTLLRGFVAWLELGKFPSTISTFTQSGYTWFSKGWREAFESGAQEPWVFRGGLTADLRRLLPVECGGDLRPPAIASAHDKLPLTIRMYTHEDEKAMVEICLRTCRDGADGGELFPPPLDTLPADRLVLPYTTLHPEFCMVLEDDDRDEPAADRYNGTSSSVVGFACATLNSVEFHSKLEAAWVPAMCEKYLPRDDVSDLAKEYLKDFHSWSMCAPPAAVARTHPAAVTCRALPSHDALAPPRVITCLLAALAAHGCKGVHTVVSLSDTSSQQLFGRLGFVEVWRDPTRLYLARGF